MVLFEAVTTPVEAVALGLCPSVMDNLTIGSCKRDRN